MHSENTTSLNYQASMWLAPVFTKQELTSGSRKWGHLPTIGIPKAIYHYMTNTTKQQPTYQLFQNTMRPKNQLVNPPKMTKFTSICASSQFLLQFCKWPQPSEAWPMGQSRVDLGVTWLAKWRGRTHPWTPEWCRIQRFIHTFQWHTVKKGNNASTITLWLISSLGPR